MHGVLLRTFKRFVVDEYGRDAWDAAASSAGVGPKVYLPVESYADEEAYALIDATVSETGTERAALLEAFGRRVAAALLETYGDVVPDEWTALDLVADVETRVHAALRTRNADLEPPELACTRDGPDQVTVVYDSERALCDVARGILLGVADHYGADLTVSEAACVYEGSGHCELVVSR